MVPLQPKPDKEMGLSRKSSGLWRHVHKEDMGMPALFFLLLLSYHEVNSFALSHVPGYDFLPSTA